LAALHTDSRAALIASVALHGQALQEAKAGHPCDADRGFLGGWAAFRLIARLPPSLRASQLARTVEDIIDISDDLEPGREHVRGLDDTPVTLVEYGDCPCPHCGQAETVVRQLLLSFGEVLRYVWRHLPLSGRASARPAGRRGSRGRGRANGKRHRGAYDAASLSSAVKAARAGRRRPSVGSRAASPPQNIACRVPRACAVTQRTAPGPFRSS
jgi:hypothetical protein